MWKRAKRRREPVTNLVQPASPDDHIRILDAEKVGVQPIGPLREAVPSVRVVAHSRYSPREVKAASSNIHAQLRGSDDRFAGLTLDEVIDALDAVLLTIEDSRHGLERAEREVHANLYRAYADKQRELFQAQAAETARRLAQARVVEQEIERVWDRWVLGCSSELISKLAVVGARARVLAMFVADRHELFGLKTKRHAAEVFQAMLDEVDPNHMGGAVDDFLYGFIWDRAWFKLDAEERKELAQALRQIDVQSVADDLEQAEGAPRPDFMALAAGISDELVSKGLCKPGDIDLHATQHRLERSMERERNRPSKVSVVTAGVQHRLARNLMDERALRRKLELPQILLDEAAAREVKRAKQRAKAERLKAEAAAKDVERAKQRAKAERTRSAQERIRLAHVEAQRRLSDLNEPEQVLISSAASAEENAERWMRFFGYDDASVTPPGPDGGLDVVASTGVAQVKAEVTKTGGEAVQKFFGAAADGHGKKDRLFFSNAGYTEKALGYANRSEMALFTFDVFGKVTPVNQKARDIAAPKISQGSSGYVS